ncbi:sensor histidine kinase [Sulfuritalea hydrogenivorans]|uniref:histidine kinase n=1 Tax=Sulfuritalea hydrogenivorans sk43H TaxID=1223802 RepID=W0SAP2_9PROT|nr:ATP-binding protein [Sulfuritalea hydrogenivorans]MDK9713844.1 ATP-binding protein [Sulfuritalea sp.]BAO27947.1 multi-sensor signal transduction histidine kinase [Sulfuritalea hydrogenivorans sk43H]
MRVALAVVAALGAILLFLLASASANTALFAENYPWLLAINGIAAVALVVLVGLKLRRLRRDFRSGVFGSRLKSRLLLMLSLMAVLPGALVYGVSMQFAVKSIDSWFDVRVDAALEGGLNLGRSVLDTLQADLLEKARDAALDLGDDAFVTPSRLNRLREQAGAQSATLMTLSGQVLGSSSGELGSLLPSVPAPSQLRAARSGRGLALIGDAEGGGLMLRALAPVTSSGLNLDPRILQLTLAVPASIARSAQSVEAAHRDYQELQLGRVGLKRIYTLTLTLALLLALFAAIALAFFLAERLARPLLILAEGTQAVASGDYTPRATVEASDELGVLTHSFNSMTHQLSEARAQAEHHRQEMEAAQAYLESVLANLSAGVLAFDVRFRLRAANRGATAILGDDLAGFEQMRLQDWPRHETLAGAILGGFARRGDEWQEQLEIARPDGMPQALLVRGTALPGAGGGGYVVVFDDITRLIAAQRSAAWGEVAQRLAHEIKNPLTPIQLSAERLQLKLADQLTGASRELLDRATQTIVNQVEAMKNMVNDFRDYARTPLPQLAAVDLQALLGEILGLYENSAAAIAVAPAPTPVPPVLADANQLRQVLHNVLTNAQDALGGVADARITIAVAQEAARARLTVKDNGPGFPPQILSRAFEPYVTTKSKGTGLGLAIVKKIVDDHGGEIRLTNNNGGAVSIWLPLAVQNAGKGA